MLLLSWMQLENFSFINLKNLFNLFSIQWNYLSLFILGLLALLLIITILLSSKGKSKPTAFEEKSGLKSKLKLDKRLVSKKTYRYCRCGCSIFN